MSVLGITWVPVFATVPGVPESPVLRYTRLTVYSFMML
jgi:hypothetical protein